VNAQYKNSIAIHNIDHRQMFAFEYFINHVKLYGVDDSDKSDSNHSVASIVARSMRIFCLIMTGAHNHQTRCQAVKETWGKRCDKYIFISDAEDLNLPAIRPEGVKTGHEMLWGKLKGGLKYVYEKYGKEYDWFIRNDDDAFVMMENLRYLLLSHDPQKPIYFGCKFKPYTKYGYMSGGPGIVMSKEALRILVEEALPNTTFCSQEDGGSF